MGGPSQVDPAVYRSKNDGRRKPRRRVEIIDNVRHLWCNKCESMLPETAFYEMRSIGPLVRSSYCKSCNANRKMGGGGRKGNRVRNFTPMTSGAMNQDAKFFDLKIYAKAAKEVNEECDKHLKDVDIGMICVPKALRPYMELIADLQEKAEKLNISFRDGMCHAMTDWIRKEHRPRAKPIRGDDTEIPDRLPVAGKCSGASGTFQEGDGI